MLGLGCSSISGTAIRTVVAPNSKKIGKIKKQLLYFRGIQTVVFFYFVGGKARVLKLIPQSIPRLMAKKMIALCT